ncbi:MAG TPA: M90 family metallopeptidase [Gammaproteobacteria bacterium]|nr:M90 family metallopeptidase [Gammaproteobacteria bacterium]
MFGWLKRRRRERLRTMPLPSRWKSVLARNVPYIALLTPLDRQELFGHMQVLLAEKKFTGCGGLEITDEIRVTIAAQAALLLLHRKTDYFPTMRTILVYPDLFVVNHRYEQEDGTEYEAAVEQAGESWYGGPVILSWEDVLAGAQDPHDGYNVVLHEFAHQLDDESGATDGAPALGSLARYQAWAKAFGQEYEQLQNAVLAERASLLDEYGAESPAEFFAVATECFFERPRVLRRKHPALYMQLSGYYRQDPAAFCGA